MSERSRLKECKNSVLSWKKIHHISFTRVNPLKAGKKIVVLRNFLIVTAKHIIKITVLFGFVRCTVKVFSDNSEESNGSIFKTIAFQMDVEVTVR